MLTDYATAVTAARAGQAIACPDCASIACTLDRRTWRDGLHYCRTVRTAVGTRAVRSTGSSRPRAGGKTS